MTKPDAAWLGIIAAATAFEVVAWRRDQPDVTLSHAVRVTFHTDSRPGRVAFYAAWFALSCWLIPHIVDEAEHPSK